MLENFKWPNYQPALKQLNQHKMLCSLKQFWTSNIFGSRSHCSCRLQSVLWGTVKLSHFQRDTFVSTRFSKNIQAIIFKISVQCEIRCSMLTNGQDFCITPLCLIHQVLHRFRFFKYLIISMLVILQTIFCRIGVIIQIWVKELLLTSRFLVTCFSSVGVELSWHNT